MKIHQTIQNLSKPNPKTAHPRASKTPLPRRIRDFTTRNLGIQNP